MNEYLENAQENHETRLMSFLGNIFSSLNLEGVLLYLLEHASSEDNSGSLQKNLKASLIIIFFNKIQYDWPTLSEPRFKDSMDGRC